MIRGFIFFIFLCQFILQSSLGGGGILLAQEMKKVNLSPVQVLDSQNGHLPEKCGQMILESQLEKEMGFFGSKPFFENWIDQKIEESRYQPQILSRINQEPRLIAVVVHVIHSGQAIGTGSNIPRSQIDAQIRILNEDYRRQNADANLTPSEFLPVAADSNIEFVLAKQDPQGLPTDGIVRVQGFKTSYSPVDATMIGQLSQWDPNEYLNVWVASLTMPFIGYASFPISDLPGLGDSPSSASVDGVTIDFRYFGVGGNAATNYFGRTATHEIGHYLGLRHIWGDGGCGVDDFVEDTPLQDGSNLTCSPSATKTSCGNVNMIQNYMDYTPDACMNLFTKGQVERFNVVLANSPRRVSLVNGRATKNPVLEQRDLGITRVIQPELFSCSGAISPIIEIKNVGILTLNSAKILLFRNKELMEERKFSFSLASGESSRVNFKSIPVLSGTNELEFRIIQVNNLPDQNLSNNTKAISTIVQGKIELPYTFDIGANTDSWSIKNPDEAYTWESTQLTISGQEQSVFYIRNYDYDAPGQQDYLISPSVDLSNYPEAQLVFDMSYARFTLSGYQDELIVAVSQDCGNNFDFVNATYKKFGELLDTSGGSLEEFIPTQENQFRKELVNLKGFANLGKIKIAFISKTGFGNNIYLKNIQILPQELYEYNLKINEIVSPNPIVDGTQDFEIIRVTNTGNLPVSKFFVTQSTSGTGSLTSISEEKTIIPGESILIQSKHTTTSGKNRLDYKVFWPNGDQNQGDIGSSIRQYIIEDDFRISTPWRQKFDNAQTFLPWLAINPELDNEGWQIASTATGTGPNFIAKLENQQVDNTYWLGTPVFDASKRSQASIFFDVAVGEVSSTTSLKLLMSEDAGETYIEAWKSTGNELMTISSGQVNPNSPGDFVKHYVNLSNIAGKGKNRSRVAFVVEGGLESDAPIYLDNIEFFLNANPEPVIPGEKNFTLYPNPANEIFNIAFNLPNFEVVSIQIISSTGEIVQNSSFDQTLNQTYSFSTSLFNKGLFLVKISSKSIQETRKLIIQ